MSDRIYLYTDGRDDEAADLSLKQHGTPEACAAAFHLPGPWKAYGNDPAVMLRFLEALEERGWPGVEELACIEVEGFQVLEYGSTMKECRAGCCPNLRDSTECRAVLTRAKERRRV